MIVSMIVACTIDGVIGSDGDMPWYLPEDLKHFKSTTMGKPVIMGRKTYDSIGRPLCGRHNIVVSRNKGLHIEGVDCVSTIEEAIEKAGNVDECVVIGGGILYGLFLPMTDRLYMTEINLTVEGDTYFPRIDKDVWEWDRYDTYVSDGGLEYTIIELNKR